MESMNDKLLDKNKIEYIIDVQTVIDRLNDLARQGDLVFRGYGKQDELFPNIIRANDYSNLEEKLLGDFENYGKNYYNAITPIDFMSCAQHFGLPTRLLDFTFNPFIALSFALYMTKNNNYKNQNDKEYYYIRYASIKKNICIPSIPLKDSIYNSNLFKTDSLARKSCQCIGSVTDLFGQNYLGRTSSSICETEFTIDNLLGMQEKIDSRAILFINPNQANQRIIMQQGLFMFPYTLNKEEHLKILEKNTNCIMIHKDVRNELLKYLEILGYNAFRLMPDLSSICAAIKRKNIDERRK